MCLSGTCVTKGGSAFSRPSTFCVYSRNRRPSVESLANRRWKRVGLASADMLDRLRTMSWKLEVEESSLYTEASNSSLPELLSLCSPLRLLNKPCDERKSGIPAETDMPAPAITTIFRLFLIAFNSVSRASLRSYSDCAVSEMRSRC